MEATTSLQTPARGSFREQAVRIGLVLAAAAVTVGLCLRSSDLNSTAQPGVVMALPDQVGDFRAGPVEGMSPEEMNLLPGDTEVVRRVYENPAGDRINCSIVLAGGEKRSIHRPEICLPSQGWTLGTGGVMKVPLESGRDLEVMRLALRRDMQTGPSTFRPVRSEFLYWFIGKDTTTASHLTRILKTSWDRVFHHVNHRWAYVIVSSAVTDNMRSNGLGPEQTDEMLKKFIREAVPSFQQSERPGS